MGAGGELGEDPRLASANRDALESTKLPQDYPISMFARLTLILRDGKRAKQAFSGMGQPL